MTSTIWLERTDAQVGLQVDLIGQLAWWVNICLRSDKDSGRRRLCSGPTPRGGGTVGKRA
jgi:hypothetical protein